MNKPFLSSLGFLIAHAVCHAQVTYAAAEQFSPTSNPAGVWSYGYAGSLGAFNLFTLNSTAGDGFYAWARELMFPSNLPCVHKNNSGKIHTGGGNVFQVDQMAFHPGNNVADQYAVVRFAAPTTGVYTVAARFSGLYALDAGTTTDVHVLVNGTSFFGSRVEGYASEVSFTSPFTLTLRQGDTIDFAVGNGGNEFYGDETGLSATVTLVQPGIAVRLYPAVEIEWGTEVGKKYQVQWSATLLTEDWTDVGATVLGDGRSQYAFDSVRSQPTKFYRVVTVP